MFQMFCKHISQCLENFNCQKLETFQKVHMLSIKVAQIQHLNLSFCKLDIQSRINQKKQLKIHTLEISKQTKYGQSWSSFIQCLELERERSQIRPVLSGFAIVSSSQTCFRFIQRIFTCCQELFYIISLCSVADFFACFS